MDGAKADVSVHTAACISEMETFVMITIEVPVGLCRLKWREVTTSAELRQDGIQQPQQGCYAAQRFYLH